MNYTKLKCLNCDYILTVMKVQASKYKACPCPNCMKYTLKEVGK